MLHFRASCSMCFLLLIFSIQGSAKESTRNSLWCFAIASSSLVKVDECNVEFNVRYLDRKKKTWKSVQQTQKGWGVQPEFSLDRCFQFFAPANIRAFEISLFINQTRYSILVDQIPDSISRHKLIGFPSIIIKEKNTQFAFQEIKGTIVSDLYSKEMLFLEDIKRAHRVETNKKIYEKSSPIKIYIEAIDSTQLVILYGCGTPGTLYKVQQWINGGWVDYKNTWGVKCGYEKFSIFRYIVGLSIDRIGVFRIVFDKPSDENSIDYLIVSNAFRVV